jgi:predicted NUDIX family phosphoesterase
MKPPTLPAWLGRATRPRVPHDDTPADDPDRVLCVPSAAFNGHPERFDGFYPGTERFLGPLLKPGVYAFHARTKGPGGLEEDEGWKQLVAYVLLRRDDRVALFRRTGGEGRLAGKLTVGLGGHVELRDVWPVDIGEPDLRWAIGRAAWREIQEEIRLPDRRAEWPSEWRQVGLVNDDRDPVGRVHLGVVWSCWVDREEVIVKDPGLEFQGWANALTLFRARDAGEMESWSALISVGLLER